MKNMITLTTLILMFCNLFPLTLKAQSFLELQNSKKKIDTSYSLKVDTPIYKTIPDLMESFVLTKDGKAVEAFQLIHCWIDAGTRVFVEDEYVGYNFSAIDFARSIPENECTSFTVPEAEGIYYTHGIIPTQSWK